MYQTPIFLHTFLNFPGAADHGGFLRLRCFQQPQPPVQRRVLLPAHENPNHARGGGASAGIFQGTSVCRKQEETPTHTYGGDIIMAVGVQQEIYLFMHG